MKNKYVERFDDILYRELLKNTKTYKMKKEIIKKFKKHNPRIYKEKRDDFFDEVHPY